MTALTKEEWAAIAAANPGIPYGKGLPPNSCECYAKKRPIEKMNDFLCGTCRRVLGRREATWIMAAFD